MYVAGLHTGYVWMTAVGCYMHYNRCCNIVSFVERVMVVGTVVVSSARDQRCARSVVS